MEDFRQLKRPLASNKTDTTLDGNVASCVSELMNARTSFHKLHLRVSGLGSLASHLALATLYDSLPDFADSLAESFMGASEKMLEYKENSVKVLNSKEEALSYIRELYISITSLQTIMPYTDIVNDLDTIKSTLNSIKYKLLFLQ